MNGFLAESSGWMRDLLASVRADAGTVFNLIAEVELWPALFRHVRSARVLRRDGRRRLIAVNVAWRHLPLGYTAVQTIEDDEYRTTIRHVSRLSAGSIERWMVRPATRVDGLPGVEVHLHQLVRVPVPIIGGRLARGLFGGLVARDLGQSALERLREIAEGGTLAGRR